MVRYYHPSEKQQRGVTKIIKDLFAEIKCAAYPPCVYFLFNNDDLVYVGQTVNLLSRIGTHINSAIYSEKAKQFNRVFFVPCDIDKLLETEQAFIKFLTPPGNIDKFKDRWNELDSIRVAQVLGLNAKMLGDMSATSS